MPLEGLPNTTDLYFAPLFSEANGEKSTSGKIDLGRTREGVSIDVPGKAWPLDELDGDVIIEALFRSITQLTVRTEDFRRRNLYWTEFSGANSENILQPALYAIMDAQTELGLHQDVIR